MGPGSEDYMTIDAIIAALEHELAGYIRRGLKDRAALVEQELARLGRSPGATPSEVVPAEPGSTPTKPATRARKPVERVADAPAYEPPAKPRKAKK